MTGLAVGFAVLLNGLAGLLLVWRLWPTRCKPVLPIAVLSWPAGLALTSQLYFLWLVISGGEAQWYPLVEGVLLLGAALWCWRSARRRGERVLWPRLARSGSRVASMLEAVLPAAMLLVVALAGLGIWRLAEASPWGYWDAWCRINLKARFLCAGGPQWTWIFHGESVSHHDYPLLLNCAVARLWRWGGGEMVWLAPATLSLLNALALVLSVAVLIGYLSRPAAGALAGLLLLADPALRWWAAMQYADQLLATYMVALGGLLVLASPRSRRNATRWWPLLGFFAGCTAWCKNEGLTCALLALVLALWPMRRRDRRYWLASGRLLGMAALGAFSVAVLKLGYAGRSSVFAARQQSIWADLIDVERWRLLGEKFWSVGLQCYFSGTVALLVMALLILPAPAVRRWHAGRLLLLLGGQGLVYVLVFITTREDLAWHLDTALPRLAMGLWPLIVTALAVTRRRPTPVCRTIHHR